MGTVIAVHETPTHYELFAGPTRIASHAKHPRFAVVMDPAHYAGLLRPGGLPLTPLPPQWAPGTEASAEKA